MLANPVCNCVLFVCDSVSSEAGLNLIHSETEGADYLDMSPLVKGSTSINMHCITWHQSPIVMIMTFI